VLDGGPIGAPLISDISAILRELERTDLKAKPRLQPNWQEVWIVLPRFSLARLGSAKFYLMDFVAPPVYSFEYAR
jgi:hypothetical protein